jgi:hypothetical protein
MCLLESHMSGKPNICVERFFILLFWRLKSYCKARKMKKNIKLSFFVEVWMA